MSTRSRIHDWVLSLTASGLLLGAPARAHAQSLAVFLEGADAHSPEQREAEATARQRSEEAAQNLTRLLPALSVTAGYTRNQQAVEFSTPSNPADPTAQPRTITITPIDQVDATVRLEVPLVDVGAWQRLSAARATEEAARERVRVSRDDVRRSVARSYYQWAAATALVASAQQSLAVAERSLERARARLRAELGSTLDVRRAESEAARARQTLAEARASAENSAHALESATGVTPREPPPLDDALGDEGSLDQWQRALEQHPSVRAARAELSASEAQARAGWSALAPTLSGTVQERFTNAVGFGFPAFFSAGLSLTWRIDGGTVFAARALDAQRSVAQARAERALRATRDAVFTDYTNVRANTERARAARAQQASAEAAAEEARSRLARGTATEYDVLLAERDAFAARVSRLQADADLLYARALLRIDANQAISSGEASATARAPWR